ncbi:MAG: sigma-70 family RNA polymerase sigma factor [Planctomycetota bacterium]|nr:sigma-70 family RNA polymerase sigma factor [Planctomycetota bacterium]
MAMDAKSDDSELVAQALQGDGGAWTALVEKYGQLVWSVGRRSGLSRTDSDDLVQAVFAILVGRLRDLRDRDRLAGWLVVTARREAWRLSKRARRERATDPDHLPESDAEGEDAEEQAFRRQAVREAMARLGSRCRDLLVKIFGGTQTPGYDELAKSLGLNPNSIGPTRRRCLEELLEHLKADPDGLLQESV